jgi:hypothetical protein
MKTKSFDWMFSGCAAARGSLAQPIDPEVPPYRARAVGMLDPGFPDRKGAPRRGKRQACTRFCGRARRVRMAVARRRTLLCSTDWSTSRTA